MGVLIIFVAGVSVGFVADKLYNAFVIDDELSDEPRTNLETAPNTLEKPTTPSTDVTDTITVDEGEQNDFSQLKGVGPRLVEALRDIGIHNYDELSRSSPDALFEKLKETGGRFNRPVVSSIIEQAKQAIENTEKA